MSNNTNSLVDEILSTLSPETRSVLESHYLQQLVSEMSTKLSLDVLSTKPVSTTKRFINRQKTNDGTDRSASKYIRDIDENQPGLSASEVVKLAVSVGLDIESSLVYNVRQNLKKKTGVTMVTNPATAEEIKAKRQAAAAKARKVKAEKKVARDAALVEDVVKNLTEVVVKSDSEVVKAVEELVQLEAQVSIKSDEVISDTVDIEIVNAN
jgi:hypothetical protein